jgi:hypothetical protein
LYGRSRYSVHGLDDVRPRTQNKWALACIGVLLDRSGRTPRGRRIEHVRALHRTARRGVELKRLARAPDRRPVRPGRQRHGRRPELSRRQIHETCRRRPRAVSGATTDPRDLHAGPTLFVPPAHGGGRTASHRPGIRTPARVVLCTYNTCRRGRRAGALARSASSWT